MAGRKFLLLIFILIVTSFYTNAQFNSKKDAASKNKTIQNLSASIKAVTDTIYPSIIKEDFIVNNFEGEFGADQKNAAAAMDGEGNYAIAWLDYRNEKPDIYAQFFNANDEKIGPNIKVNQQPAALYSPPSIAANNKGDFVIAWNSQINNTIEVKGYNVDGENINNVFETNIPAYSQPSVVANNNGSFLICWYGQNIMAELFDRRGNPIKTDIFVNELNTYYSSFVPGKNIAIDNKGNFYIVWITYENNDVSKFYLQIIDSLGEKVNNNILVSNLSDSSNKNSPQIASTNNGNILIAWNYSITINGSNTSGEKIRIYNSDGNSFTNEISIAIAPDKIVSGGDSTFFISYLSYDIQGSYQQFMQEINTNGEIIEYKEMKFDTNKNFQLTKTDLSNMVDNHFIIVPEVNERNDANIYVQKFNADLETVSAFTKVHDDSGSAYQQNPLVKFNNKGESIVLWEDKRNGRFDLYAQLYNKDFNPTGNNIMINETDAEQFNLMDKKVQCLSDGTFVVAYSYYDNYSYNYKVYMRLINENNLGKNVSVKSEEIYESLNLALNINSNDEILICFYSNMNAFLRKFDKNLSPLSSPIKFIQYQYSNSNIINFYINTVSIDTYFNLFTVGRFSSSNTNQIIGKFFNEEGKETSNFVIANNDNLSYSNIKCINNNGSYAVIYNTYNKVYVNRRYSLDREYFLSNEFDIQSSAYNSYLNLIEFKNQKLLLTFNSFTDAIAAFINDNKREIKLSKVHTYPYPSPLDLYNQNFGNNYSDYYNDKLFFTYESNNQGTGYDIQANVQNADSINFNEESFLILPIEDALLNNYPNPFNNKTRITYKLAAYHKVKLTIYDILGRQVKVLVDRYQDRGTYEVDFNASGLASGIYIYRLEAFDTIIKKMILLK